MDQGYLGDEPDGGEDSKLKLLADLLSQSAKDSANVTNALIDNLQRQNDQLRASLNLITEEITRMCSGDLMYSPNAIMRALYPERDAIADQVDEYRRERGQG